MKSTLYQSLLSRLKNKHSKLSSRFHKNVKEGEFQKLRYRNRRNAVERLKSLEKRIAGISKESGVKTQLNYKHWAVALAFGVIVATSNQAAAQEVDLAPPIILGNSYTVNVLTGDIDGDGDNDIIYVSYFDDPIIFRNDGAFSFASTPLSNTAGAVENSILADFDGDGDLDIFMQNGNGATAQVFVNDGTGNFASVPATMPAVNFNEDLELTGDIDGDGDLDFVAETRQTVSPFYRFVTLLRNDSFDFSDTTAIEGTYVFQPSTDLIGLIDADGDDNLDVLSKAYIISTGTPLQVFSNDGIGNFSYAGPYTPVFNAYNAGDTLDIDDDGDTEIVIPFDSYPNPYVRILVNGGAGGNLFTTGNTLTFNNNESIRDVFPSDINNDGLDEFVINTEADSTFIFETSVGGLVTSQIAKFKGESRPGDLDGDGDADLLFGSNGVFSIYENEGGGTFTPNTDLLTVSAVYDVDTVDIDNDGNVDIVTASEDFPSRVWLNDGTGNFTVGQVLAGPSYEQVFGDFDQDGDQDMIRAAENTTGVPNPGIEIWRNDGGVLSPIDTIGFGSWEASDIELAFLDGDGDLDIAVYHTQGCCSKYVETFLGGTDLTFASADTYYVNNELSRIDTADIDGDADTDLLIAFYGSRVVRTLLNDGLGMVSFGSSFSNYSPNDYSDLDAFDVDGDNDIDAVITSGTYIQIFLNDGAGAFTYNTQINLPQGVYQSFHTDIDQDGDQDLIFGGEDSAIKPRIYLNDGAGVFTFDSEIDVYSDEYTKIRTADLDNDGDLDVILGGYYSGLKVLLNNDIIGDPPEINVTGTGDIDILNGDTAPQLADGTDFGSVIIGEPGTSTFTIENLGDQELTVSNIQVSGPDAADFSLDITSAAIPGLTSTDFVVTFSPSTLGSKGATIQIANDDSDESTYSFDITGLATAPDINVQGNSTDISIGDTTPDAADGTDFGTIPLGTPAVQSFTIQNTGDAELTVNEINISGADAADFTISNITLPATIAISGDETFDLTFNPAALGTSVASIEIVSNDFDESSFTFDVTGVAQNPQEINVQGSGEDITLGDNTPSVSDGTDFGLVTIGQSASSAFTIQNLGDANLDISSVTVSATDGTNDVSADFSVDSDFALPGAVAGLADSTFMITYTPTTSGTITGSVVITNNDADESSYDFAIAAISQTAQEINVQGNSIDIASGDNTPSVDDRTRFGSIELGFSLISTFTIQNQGDEDLNITSISLTGADADQFSISLIVPTPFVISGGSEQVFEVTFEPTSFGSKSATINIASDDADESTYTFDIQGSGKAPGIQEADSLALVAIYNSTGGAAWTNNTNWLQTGQRVENWFGVQIDGDRVQKIDLTENNLSGTIPTEIGDLTALTDLLMGDNSLTGPIPSEIGQTNLDTLVLSINQLSGSIPDEIYDLTELRRLSISQNELEGTISSDIGNLTNLTFIALWDNPFTGGTLPAEFWTLSSLQRVFLGTSDLGGDISQFTNLTNLVEFWVDQGNFTGTVSGDLANLTNLERLDISDNQMTGEIPAALASLSNLFLIEVQNNSFTAFPDVSGLTLLTTLNVSGNSLDFDDLEPNASVTGFVYAPQNDLNVPIEISIDGGDPIAAEDTAIRAESEVAITGITGESTNNQYDWNVNGTVSTEQTEITYEIPSMGRADEATYGLTVTNDLLPDLTFTSAEFELSANAVISVRAIDVNTQSPISENVNAYLFPLGEDLGDTINFDGVPGVFNSPSTLSFPAVDLEDYQVVVESVVPVIVDGEQNPDATYVPTFFGDALSEDAETLVLEKDTILFISMLELPDEEPPGEGALAGTIEEDFGDEEARVNTRRRAKRRKCGLRRRRTGGRQDDNFELFAYGETNDQGEFEFGFLPEGTYRFFVEYPGIPLDPDAEVEFTVGAAGVSDDSFTLAVFASPEGIEIEFILGFTRDYFTEFNIYPNPTADLLNIEYSEIRVNQVFMEIMSLDGQILYKKELSKSENGFQYDTALLKPGMYLVRFRGDAGKEHLVYRIIKK